MELRKVVIPVAGSGSRLLPVTKTLPKEMLPVGRKPAVQYVVEEALAAGLPQILFVTGRHKTAIEDHFHPVSELEQRLQDPERASLIEEPMYRRSDWRCYFVRQPAPTGLADAVATAADFVGQESFVVSLGDSIVTSDQPGRLIERMERCRQETGAACVVALEQVRAEELHHYGVVRVRDQGKAWVEIEDLVEKPDAMAAPSHLTIASRYVFTPAIFECIRSTIPSAHTGTRELTDSIRLLVQQGQRVCGVQLAPGEARYDIGDFASYFRAFCEMAIADQKYGYTFRQYLIRRREEM
jgi:UTP--glucose-1-phosphate uridylyltransferase